MHFLLVLTMCTKHTALIFDANLTGFQQHSAPATHVTCTYFIFLTLLI